MATPCSRPVNPARSDRLLNDGSPAYGWQWQKARKQHLQDNPLCVFCLPRLTLASVVDHKVPHKGDPALFWDRSNWQSLCKHCHDSRKKRIEQHGHDFGGDADGIPLDPGHHWNR